MSWSLEISLAELVSRYLRSRLPLDAADVPLLTAAMLLTDNSEIHDLYLERPRREFLDGELVERVLAVCSPMETAYVLSRIFGTGLPVEVFRRHFERVLEATDDWLVVTLAAGAAHDFLKLHPRAFEIPPRVADILLAAPDADARFTGLRILRRLEPRSPRLYAAIEKALGSSAEGEQLVALNMVSDILDETLGGKPLPEVERQWLIPIVAKAALLAHGRAGSVRDTVPRVMRYAAELGLVAEG